MAGYSASADRELANSLYSIFDAYIEVSGNWVPHYESVSPKLQCPYVGLFHNNPKTLRIYPETNSAWCFSCREYMTPVSLIMAFKGLDESDACQWVKERVGYQPPDPEQVWESLVSEGGLELDTSYLAEALKVACSRMSTSWREEQFNDEVSRKLSQCLSLLPRVRTEEDADIWLSASKRAMANVLGVSPTV